MIQALAPSGATETADNEAHHVLRDVADRWNMAARTWDVEALTALYTPDVVMYGGRPGMSIGHDGMRRYFASYTGLLASTRLELRDQVMIALAPKVYLAQGYGDFSFVLTSGKRSGTTMRTTWILVERAGQWKILQHHFSTTPEQPPIPQ
ncbi:MAG: SgcJ/EcaC family oxidoreductase [Pseudomonadota bacterium]